MLSGKYLGQRPPGARLRLFTRFSRYSNPLGTAATRAYCQLALRYGLSPAQMALAFVTGRPFATACIIGATTPEQLKEDIEGAQMRLPGEVLEAIEAIRTRQPNPCP